jgi:predicted AlkP superfamily pyrophosphatase or phosphodiesterase
MKSLFCKIFIIIILFVLASCNSNTTEKKIETELKSQKTKHVILIGSDGFGAYAFNEKAKIPHIRTLMNEGSYSLKARAVLPSSSAVNWASMIMGSGPELHGYTEWGSKTPELPSRIIATYSIYPTIISVIDNQLPKAKKGVAYTWEGIGYLFENSLVDMNYNGKSDSETLEKALEFLKTEKPVFTFIHFDEPDITGHGIGHNTPEYYAAIEKVDSLVGNIIDTLEQEKMLKESVIIFTSDHGGLEKGHGGKTLLEVEIPWIIYGHNIPVNGKLDKSIVTYDTAATIAHVLGLDAPEFWRGKSVINID